MRKGATKRAMFVDTGNTGRGERVRWDSKMRFGVLGLLVIASMAATPVLAKTILTSGPKPTVIDPGRRPFAFEQPPTIKTDVGRDEPFLEGEIAYGYSGRVITPIQRGSDIVATAGSPAYGVPMRVRDRDNLAQMTDQPQFGGKSWATEAGPPELVWCAVTHKPGTAKVGTVCLFNEGLSFGGNDSLMTTANYLLDRDQYGGGEIAPAPFELGAPVRVRYYVQNLGKIARIKGQIWVGDQMVNQWGYIFGDIGRGSQPDERLFSIGGGVVGIKPDPASKGRFTLRIASPLMPGGSARLVEVRNDSRMTARQP